MACDKSGVDIAVADNGVGIGPEMLGSVFDLFSQADRSLERSQGGLGIGLSLVKGLVEMHGGTVQAQSDGPGQGSTFTIHLPASVIAQRPAARPAPKKPQSAPSSRRILVVDDNVDAAESLRMLLEGLGHEVEVVNDGREAVGAAQRLRPDVILLDIGLPGMDGFHIARALRTLPETSAARLIALSGYGQERDREKSRAAGFDLHLVKPVDPSKLTAAITAAD